MITLWDGYTITADEYQFILGKPLVRSIKGKTTECTVDATYHATLVQALRIFHGMKLRECVRNSDMTLLGAIMASKQIEERIRTLVHEPSFMKNAELLEDARK